MIPLTNHDCSTVAVRLQQFIQTSYAYVPHHPIPLKSTHLKDMCSSITSTLVSWVRFMLPADTPEKWGHSEAARPKHLIGDLAINLFGGLVSDHLDALSRLDTSGPMAGFILDLYLLFMLLNHEGRIVTNNSGINRQQWGFRNCDCFER
jgi:hypothetical protein